MVSTGRLGGGLVRFGGRVGMVGYKLSEYDVTAVGEDLRLRFPEGMRSTVDANLAVQGRAGSPTVTGTVLVKSASWSRGLDTSSGLFSGLTTGDASLPVVLGQVNDPTSALRFDVRILAPSTLHIENDQARIVASTDLTLRGTYERPLLFGHADIDRGEVEFEGRRYLVTRGTLDFANPNRIQPFFDVEAETRVRVPGQTYRITLRMAGTTERLQPEFTSDPPLASLDILTLLFSDRAPSGDVELAGLQRPNEREQRLVEARAARALTGALSAEVGKVVEQTFGVDTFQITPLLSDPYQQSARLNVNPTARVTIGKAHLHSHLPDLRPHALLVHSRRDHPARVRRERHAVVGTVAERRPYVRSRGSQEAHLLMRWRIILAAIALLSAAEAQASPEQYVGRIIVDVRVELAEQPSSEASVLQVVETRVGEPFSMLAVRSTIDHLIGLGRFEDVRVDAVPSAQGVALRLVLDADSPHRARELERGCGTVRERRANRN
jgi:hypothetical protein